MLRHTLLWIIIIIIIIIIVTIIIMGHSQCLGDVWPTPAARTLILQVSGTLLEDLGSWTSWIRTGTCLIGSSFVLTKIWRRISLNNDALRLLVLQSVITCRKACLTLCRKRQIENEGERLLGDILHLLLDHIPLFIKCLVNICCLF